MTIEGYSPSQDDFSADSLELYKENADAPFETVNKNEEPPEYPYVFLNKLKANWSRTCDFMNWRKDGQKLDWKFFKVAREPLSVVSGIQTKILEEGGSLPRFGVDGLFGPETTAALWEVTEKEDEREDEHVDDLAATTLRISDILPDKHAERTGLSESFLRAKVGEVVTVLPRVEARIKQAGLDLEKDWLTKMLENDGFDEADVADFQSRALKFREDLIGEDSRLAPLNELVSQLIPFLETEVKKIDLSKIKSAEDLRKVLGELSKNLKTKLDSMKGIMSDQQAEELLQNIDIEKFMAFFMSAIHEMALLLGQHFKDNRQNFERIIKIFRDEMLLQAKSAMRGMHVGGQFDLPKVIRVPMNGHERVTHEDSEAAESQLGNHDEKLDEMQPRETTEIYVQQWDELVRQGPLSSGKMEFDSEGRPIVLNLDNSSLEVAGKKAQLILPKGAKLTSIQAMADGGMALNATLGFFSARQILSRDELDSYFDKIAASEKGARIDIGRGAYFQV